jgi:hypothetical protein
MKTLLALVAAVMLNACAHQPPAPTRNPAAFAPGAEPIPPRGSLDRFYQVSRRVDAATADSVTEVVVQANFRSERVWCSNLGGPPTRLSLSLARHVSPEGPTSVLLGVEYEASEALLISGDGLLQVRVNGTTFQPVQASEPIRREGFARSETMHYRITRDELRSIVAADTASVHLNGRAGRCDSPITGIARGLISLFLERELGDAT